MADEKPNPDKKQKAKATGGSKKSAKAKPKKAAAKKTSKPERFERRRLLFHGEHDLKGM